MGTSLGSLLRSRKFLLLMLDTLVSAVVLVAGWYLAPADLDKVIAVVGLLQPVAVAFIIGVAVEDSAALKAGAHPSQR